MQDTNEQWVWRLFSFIDARGNSAVQNWYESQSKKVQAEFETAFRYLRVSPDTDWAYPRAKALHGNCKGFIEVRFKVDRIHYRAIGFRGPEKRVYTVVRITDKNHFDDSCVKECKRRELIENDRSYRHEPDCFSDLVKEAKEQGVP